MQYSTTSSLQLLGAKHLGLFLVSLGLATSTIRAAEEPASESVEAKTKIHRFTSTKRAIYDAFAYVNRIPEKPEEGETPSDLAGRILGRLANQEGRILLKLPTGMERESYLAFKTFMRYEGTAKVGNCIACHGPAEFTDLQKHVVTKGGMPTITPSLRNLKKRKVDVRKAIMSKLVAARLKQSGDADEIDAAYAKMNISDSRALGYFGNSMVNALLVTNAAEHWRWFADAHLMGRWLHNGVLRSQLRFLGRNVRDATLFSTCFSCRSNTVVVCPHRISLGSLVSRTKPRITGLSATHHSRLTGRNDPSRSSHGRRAFCHESCRARCVIA